jgi:hypothetical protein
MGRTCFPVPASGPATKGGAIKLKIVGRRLFTEAGYPMGDRFYMHAGWPMCGWGPFATDAEAENAKTEWEKYLNKDKTMKGKK